MALAHGWRALHQTHRWAYLWLLYYYESNYRTAGDREIKVRSYDSLISGSSAAFTLGDGNGNTANWRRLHADERSLDYLTVTEQLAAAAG